MVVNRGGALIRLGWSFEGGRQEIGDFSPLLPESSQVGAELRRKKRKGILVALGTTNNDVFKRIESI